MAVLSDPPLRAEQGDLAAPRDEADLEERLSRPDEGTIAAAARLEGDCLVLGAGGKMGLSVSRMLRRALDAAGKRETRVLAVSRFGGGAPAEFADAGVETTAVDLLADGALERLPDCPNVLYLAGMKFGSSGDPAATWALNTLLPGLVARRFRGGRIVALSTGNVYGLTDVRRGGAVETDVPAPEGEYAQSCLGRERMFAHGAAAYGTRVALIRLNYANDLRYGVVVDVAKKVLAGEPVDVTMGMANVIWQGDANRAILRAFEHADSPPFVLNVSGPETVSIRRLAGRLAALLDLPAPAIAGAESETALLSNCARHHGLFGYPEVALETLARWTADWLRAGGRTLGKPTKFESRDGKF
jgi:nucleoside-diphosphate-sugar epimerase